MTPASRFAPLLILAAGACWGCTGAFARVLGDAGFTSLQITEIRLFMAALILVGIALATDRAALRVKPRDLWCLVGAGVASELFFNACYFTTISLTSLSVAAVLLYTAPVFVMALSRIVFKERVTRRKIAAALLTIVGCALVSGLLTSVPALSAAGVLIGIGSGLGYALYSVFSRLALERGYSPLAVVAWTFVFAALGGLFIVDPAATTHHIVERPESLLPLAGNAIVSTVLPYILYTTGLRHVENGRAVIFASLELVVATALGVVAFGETLSLGNLVGVSLVIVAIVLMNTAPASPSDPSRRAAAPAPPS